MADFKPASICSLSQFQFDFLARSTACSMCSLSSVEFNFRVHVVVFLGAFVQGPSTMWPAANRWLVVCGHHGRRGRRWVPWLLCGTEEGARSPDPEVKGMIDIVAPQEISICRISPVLFDRELSHVAPNWCLGRKQSEFVLPLLRQS